MTDNRWHYISRAALNLNPPATACGVKAFGKDFTTRVDKVTCALCLSSDLFIKATDDNQTEVRAPGEFVVVKDAATNDYVVLGEDPPVRELANVGHVVYLRAAAQMETAAYEKLRLAAVYRLTVDSMIENGD